MALKDKSQSVQSVESSVTQLNWACSVFLEEITTQFLGRAAKLQLFQIPSAPGGAKQASDRRTFNHGRA
jgi:hypothetical protein